METKEWPLRPEDIDVPIPEDPPLRYALIVQIVGAKKLWISEQNVVIPSKVIEEVPKTPHITPKGGPKSAFKSPDVTQKTSEPIQEKLEIVPQELVAKNLFSKVSVSFKFPGEPIPEIDVKISEPVEPKPLPPPPDPPSNLTQDEEDELSDSELPPPMLPPDPAVTEFGYIACKEFEVRSNYTLWNRLLQEPMEIIVYWTSPSGSMTKPLGRVMIDLFPALALNGESDVLAITGKVEKIPEPPMVEEKVVKAKKGKKDKEKDKTKEKEKEDNTRETEKEKEKVEKSEKGQKKSKKKKKDMLEEVSLQDILPQLLPDAVLNIVVSTSTPFWSELNRIHGLVMEISIRAVLNLPPKVQEFGSKGGGKVEKSEKLEKDEKPDKGNKVSKSEKGDPFAYTLVANIPGFTDTFWWKHVEGLLPEDRTHLEQIKLEVGKVEKEEKEEEFLLSIPKSELEHEPEFELGSEKAEWNAKVKAYNKLVNDTIDEENNLVLNFKAEATRRKEAQQKKMELQKKLLCCEQSLKNEDEDELFHKIEEEPNPIIPEPTERMVVKWPDAPSPTIKRFIPGTAALELLDLVRTGKKFRGELARYLKLPTDLFDPSFEKYHGCFFLDLSGLLEEDVTSLDLKIPFEQFTLSGTNHGITLCEAPAKPLGKKAPKNVEDDDPLPISVDPENVLPNNSWQVSKAVIVMNIRTDKPMMPRWEAPAQPDMTLEEVIPPRKKPHTIYDAMKLATQKFNEFVKTAADDLIDMYQDIIGESELRQEEPDDDHSFSPKTYRRIETKGEIRKKMVKMLRKSGTWNDMVEEMKVRVLKVAAEKYREKRRAALDVGKFEFCNDLYISLAQMIYNTLKELMAKKRELKEVETLKDTDRLRSLADDYEVSEDWTNAYRCHQERLQGDNMRNADLWFEFGCFCMRVRPKDHGKAEECWREALSQDKNHLLSLQALGCLMWHRGYLTQAEVLLRSAIDVHSLEEHISWILASQVYAAQGKFDNERACLRRAEKLYSKGQRSNYRTHYSPQHQLLSPLLQFPFSLGQLVHKTKSTSSVFIDAIVFLLDLQLHEEAQTVLKLDSDIFSCTLDNKWCRMRASELSGDLEGAEGFTKEALAINKDNYVTWLLLGHLRYSFKSTTELPDALQTCLWQGAVNAYSKYQRYLGVDQDMYQHGYLEIGMAYFKLAEFDRARKSFLKGCTVNPTCASLWLAAGVAYYFLGDMKHAELALVEGNVLDVQNFQIWGYLTLVCLRMGRDEEAENTFQQALKTNLDPQLLSSIAEHFCLVGNFRDAETAFTESLKLKDVTTVRFNRGEMYFKIGNLLAAKKDYNAIIKHPDVGPLHRSIAISRLTELQDVTEPVPINRCPQNPNYEV